MSKDIKNPYKNLSSYSEEDTAIFKGRTKETGKLFNYIMQNDIVVFYSESAEGKSSLLNAGLFPILKEKSFFPVNIIFTQNEFSEQNPDFDKIILGRIIDAMSSKEEHENSLHIPMPPSLRRTSNYSKKCEWVSTLPEANGDAFPVLSSNAWFVLRFFLIERWGVPYRPILIFDQFEEVFTQASQEWTDALFKWMSAFYSDNCPQDVFDALYRTYGDNLPAVDSPNAVKTVISMRHEYLGELDYWGTQRNLVPGLQNMRFCLKSLTLSAAEEVLNVGFESDSELKERVKATICDGDYEAMDKESDLPKVSPMLLSVLCSALFDSKENKSKLLKNFTKDEGNTFDSILIRIYNQIASKCKLEGTNKAIFEKALIDDDGRRIRVKSNSRLLKSISFDKKYKRSLIKEGIVKSTHINHEEYVELVHDQLAKVIHENRRKSQKQTRNVFTTIAVICACIGIFYATFANHLKSDDITNLAYVEEVKQEGGIHTLSDTSQNAIREVRLATKLIIKPEIKYKDISPSTFYIKDFPNLESIIIEGNETLLNKDSVFTIDFPDDSTPFLKKIEFRDSLKNIKISLHDRVNNIQVSIDSLIDSVNIYQQKLNKTLSFTTNGNSRYKYYNDVLWDLKNNEIVYINNQCLMNPSRLYYISFPHELISKEFIFQCNNKIDTIFNSSTGLNNLKPRIISSPTYLSTFRDKFYDGIVDISSDTTLYSIQPFAFKDCNITGIILPKSLKSISKDAFKNCKKLKEIYIPDSVSYIAQGAFDYCENLTKLSIPNTVHLDFSPFEGLVNLNEVELREISNENREPRLKILDGLLFQDWQLISTLNNPYHTYNSCYYDPEDSSYFSKDGILYKYYGEVSEKIKGISNAYQYRAYMIEDIPKGFRIKNQIYYSDDYYEYKTAECHYNFTGHTLTIYNSTYLSQIEVPIKSPRHYYDKITFKHIPHQLKEIVIPYPQPYFKTKEGIRNLYIELDDSIKAKTTLIVPYGCSKNYHTIEYNKFKSIEEGNLSTRIKNIISSYMLGAISVLSVNRNFGLFYNWYLVSAIIGIIIIGSAFFIIPYKGWVGMKKKNVFNSIMISLGMIITAVLGFMAFYWLSFIHIKREDPLVASIIGVLGALTALIIVFFSDPFVSLLKRIINRVKYFLNQATGI